MAKYSKKAEKAIGEKMHKMKGEDRPQAQKVAIALSEARAKGLKVPEKKEEKSHEKHEKSSKSSDRKEVKKHMKSSDKHEQLDMDKYKRDC